MKDFEYVKAKRFYETVAEFQKAWSGLGFTTEEMSGINDFRKLLLEKLNNKDMKKECRINEINEQIKKLKCEKKKLKCDDGSVEVPSFLVGDNDGNCMLSDRVGGKYASRAIWLSNRYNWELMDECGKHIILVPTKK